MRWAKVTIDLVANKVAQDKQDVENGLRDMEKLFDGNQCTLVFANKIKLATTQLSRRSDDGCNDRTPHLNNLPTSIKKVQSEPSMS